jgi:hypothetical protein
MKPCRAIVTLVLLGAAAATLSAQEKPLGDSLTVSRPPASELSLSFSRPVPLSVPWLEREQDFAAPLPYLLIPVSIAPYPLLAASDPMQKPDLTAALRLQRARAESNSTLYTILGTVQVGGVAYLAYRHIKKYGFK